MPKQRALAKQNLDLSLADLQKLLNSKFHEARLTALLVLVEQYKKADQKLKSTIVKFYLKNTQRINNWDLVDLSAPKILGHYLLNNERKILDKLASSKLLWERRIAIVATYTLIKNKEFEETLKISEKLLNDKHDLIHKASGWMLRELGKIDQNVLRNFLDKHNSKMPRTMLRYALEKLSPSDREKYLKIKYESRI